LFICFHFASVQTFTWWYDGLGELVILDVVPASDVLESRGAPQLSVRGALNFAERRHRTDVQAACRAEI
jgi:hypothetical protein